MATAEATVVSTAPRSPYPRAAVFAVVASALFMSSIDGTIVATALPTLHRDLRAPISWTGWTITAYSLGQIIALPMIGKISDTYGRRRVFLISVAVFTISSLICGLSPNIESLVAMRFVQAIGGGAFLPSATGIVSDTFGADRDRAIGSFTTIFPIGGIVGPILGGLFLAYWNWRGIFLVNVPVGLILIALGYRIIPNSAKRERQPIDFKGVVLLTFAIVCGMLAVTAIGSAHVRWWNPALLAPAGLSLATGYYFVRRAAIVDSSFIPIRLLVGRGFGNMNVINCCYGACAFGISTLIPLFAQTRYHLSVLQSSTLLTARAVGMIVVAGAATLLLRRIGYRAPMAIGFAVTSLSLLLLGLRPLFGVGAYVWLSIASGLTGLSVGFASPAANNATLQLAPDMVASISGLRGMFRQFGSIFVVSITAALVTRSSSPGQTEADVFYVLAAVMLALISLALRVPEHKGSW